MKNYLLTIILIVCTATLCRAQQYEFTINAGGGLSSLQYPDNGKTCFGGTAGVGLHYFFNSSWGFGSGINIALYNGRMVLDNYSQSSNEKLASGESFVFTYNYGHYEERATTTMVTIPLMLHYQHRIGPVVAYAALGVKVGIPITASYTAQGDFSTTGYFPSSSVTIESNLPAYGFGHYNTNSERNITLSTSFMLSAEAGVKFRLNEKINLYTGIYFDYGLNNLNKDQQPVAPLVKYQINNPSEFTYSTVTSSAMLRPLAVGVSVRLGFGITTQPKAAKASKYSGGLPEPEQSPRLGKRTNLYGKPGAHRVER